MTANDITTQEKLRQTVRDGYARIAEAGSCCGPTGDLVQLGDSAATGGGCCGAQVLSPDDLAAKIGYRVEDLAGLPAGANMGLSCGNPTAIAALKAGETVLDLGSGGGFDCFLAGPKVGEDGRVIGVDMTPAMLGKARGNIDHYRTQTGLDNVEFRLGEIEHLPVADSSVDVVISNCVINLSLDKPQVWREISRVLKPGGRVAVSDLALLKPLPEAVRSMMDALIGCVAGAVLVEDYQRMILDAGLTPTALVRKPEYIASLTGMNDPLYQRIEAALPAGASVADYVTSLDVEARK